MKELPKIALRVVQFWMSGALLVAMIISAIVAAPFMLAGKIMDGLDRGGNAIKGKIPGVYSHHKWEI